mmetsp:Transcript_12453/g.20522  ORF Transcript_12453/g.20522 Transcript_12453/m.20522 type:complete len:91 (+) Transcript_12453:159-431(+)
MDMKAQANILRPSSSKRYATTAASSIRQFELIFMSYSCPSIGFINPRTLGFVHSSLVSTESRSKVLIANYSILSQFTHQRFDQFLPMQQR